MIILSLSIKNRFNWFLFFFFLLVFGNSFGLENNEKDDIPVVGVVMSLDCPTCKKVFEKRKFLSQVCKVDGYDQICRVRYLPFIESEDDYRADLYYEIFAVDEEASEKYIEAIYTLKIDRTVDVEELAFLVSGYLGDEFDIDRILRSVRSSERLGVKKVGRIIKRFSIIDYPTFLIFEEESVKMMPPTIDTSERLEVALRWIENEME